jgi:hypothetical protein
MQAVIASSPAVTTQEAAILATRRLIPFTVQLEPCIVRFSNSNPPYLELDILVSKFHLLAKPSGHTVLASSTVLAGTKYSLQQT